MIAAISRKMRCIVLDDGRVAEFTEYYDAEGNEIEDIDKAVSAVAEHPDGMGWFAIELADWDEQTIH
jgi:hypothetical protein